MRCKANSWDLKIKQLLLFALLLLFETKTIAQIIVREIPSDQWGIERYPGVDAPKNLPINNFSKFYDQINSELKNGSVENINLCNQKKFRFKDICLGVNLDEFVSNQKSAVFPGVQLFIYKKTKNHALFNRDGSLTSYSQSIRLNQCEITSPRIAYWDQDNRFKSIKFVRELPDQFNMVTCEIKDTLLNYPVNVKYLFVNEILMKITIKIDKYYNQVPEEIRSQVEIKNLKKIYEKRFFENNQTNEQIKKISDNQIDKVVWLNEISSEVFSIDMSRDGQEQIIIEKIKPRQMLPIIAQAYQNYLENINVNKAKKDF
jgi:hypothetical protein